MTRARAWSHCNTLKRQVFALLDARGPLPTAAVVDAIRCSKRAAQAYSREWAGGGRTADPAAILAAWCELPRDCAAYTDTTRPWLRLVRAIVVQALHDARSRHPRTALQARLWLVGDECADLLAWLDRSRDAVRRWVRKLPAVNLGDVDVGEVLRKWR